MELSKPQDLPQAGRFGLPVRLRELAVVALVFVVATAWARQRGLAFEGYGAALLAIGLMLSVSLAYGATDRSRRLSDMTYFAALWVGFSMASGVCTYIAAHAGLALCDARFDRLDRALGFAWIDWYRFTLRHKAFDQFLCIAYFSLIWQILFCIVYLSRAERLGRLRELLLLAIATVVATSFASALWPAEGTFAYLNVDLERAVHLPHYRLLHGGGDLAFAVATMKGIVTFPSYHTVMALLLIYAFRGYGWLFLCMLALNLAMLLATPSYGGHYLVDMLAGAVIAALAIVLMRAAQRRAGPGAWLAA